MGEELVVQVKSYGLEATVRLFDHEPDGELACTAAIQEFTHRATFRFDEAGTARITIEGRALQDRAPVTFLREVTVTEASP